MTEPQPHQPPTKPRPLSANAGVCDDRTPIAQTGIHVAFLLSALAISYTDRITTTTDHASKAH